MIKFLTILIDFIIAPGLTWTLSLLAGFGWVGRTSQLPRSLLAGLIMLFIVSVYALQTGYQGYYQSGRKTYFYIVFIAPIIVGIVGIVVGLVVKIF
jgi:hypothetical protein